MRQASLGIWRPRNNTQATSWRGRTYPAQGIIRQSLSQVTPWWLCRHHLESSAKYALLPIVLDGVVSKYQAVHAKDGFIELT
jgi:hypothetical protein